MLEYHVYMCVVFPFSYRITDLPKRRHGIALRWTEYHDTCLRLDLQHYSFNDPHQRWRFASNWL